MLIRTLCSPIDVQFNEGRSSALEVQQNLQSAHTVDGFFTEVSSSKGILENYQVLAITWAVVAVCLII